ncbi:Conserved_hypothetical protein [Hexamita inflata]|uniref:Uncharacterized protein n=1 Tax=Hexamita inflata TaxID=28002 RepID=A0AA86QEA6_9EUKA|nr:Conserved hypothetical protein [Hexamita inflata]CAI9944142.1 Conserved hypothetical protein [Hexamita inflata]CAI9954697.1 Conserved hypothetical protein [Hexamita inflata]
MTVIGNKELYQLTADLTIVEDTPDDVEQVWNGLWDLVYKNYMDYSGSDIRGFAQFGYNADGLPAATLVNGYMRLHGISEQRQIHLVPHASRTPTLVTIGKLNRDFVSCILKNVFTALGNLCRGNAVVKVQLGHVGTFSFNGATRYYSLKLEPLTKIHASYRAGDEALCRLANKEDEFQQKDVKKYTINITNKSGTGVAAKDPEEFNLFGSKTYKGKLTQIINK